MVQRWQNGQNSCTTLVHTEIRISTRFHHFSIKANLLPAYNIKYCIRGGFAMSGVWPDSSITAGEHLTNLEA